MSNHKDNLPTPTTDLPSTRSLETPPPVAPNRERGAQRGNRNAKSHGLFSLQRRLKNAGLRKNDGRSAIERIKADWKGEIRTARGGELSPQHETILEAAANTWLLLASVDDWLLDQTSLVNRMRRELIPVIQQRSALVRSLRELLNDVGLTRVAKEVETLGEYLASRAESAGATNATESDTDARRQPIAAHSGSEAQRDG